MKTSYIIGIAVFWSVLLVVGTAGLISYENEKMITALKMANADGKQVGKVDQMVQSAIEQGQTLWTTELIARHTTNTDCWIVVDGVIYDVTEYIPLHPGGSETILNTCGTDATEAFKTKGASGDDHSALAYELLARYKVAVLGDPLPVAVTATTAGEVAPTATVASSAAQTTFVSSAPSTPKVDTPSLIVSALTAAVVAAHNTVNDCWLIIKDKVYDVTEYVPFHPGGTGAIRTWCGKEATQAFSTMGGKGKNHSTNAWKLLDKYFVGSLGGSVSSAVVSTNTSSPSTTVSPTTDLATSPEEAILKEYPGATIIGVEQEDDGRATVKFYYDGEKYEAKLDAANNIVEIDD